MHYEDRKYKRLRTFPSTDPPLVPRCNNDTKKGNLIQLASGSIIGVPTSEVGNTNEDRTCVLCWTAVYRASCNLGQQCCMSTMLYELIDGVLIMPLHFRSFNTEQY